MSSPGPVSAWEWRWPGVFVIRSPPAPCSHQFPWWQAEPGRSTAQRGFQRSRSSHDSCARKLWPRGLNVSLAWANRDHFAFLKSSLHWPPLWSYHSWGYAVWILTSCSFHIDLCLCVGEEGYRLREADLFRHHASLKLRPQTGWWPGSLPAPNTCESVLCSQMVFYSVVCFNWGLLPPCRKFHRVELSFIWCLFTALKSFGIFASLKHSARARALA